MVGVNYLSTADNEVSKANRELVALGAVNGVVCMKTPSLFRSLIFPPFDSPGFLWTFLSLAIIPGLPVYGGLARSKINEYSGSKTALSGVALAFFTFLATQFLLKPLAWLPVSTLSLSTNTFLNLTLG